MQKNGTGNFSARKILKGTKMKKIMTISLVMIMISGCVSQMRITDSQMTQAEGWARSPIVWSRTEAGRNPWADGQKIYIDLTYIEKHNLPLRPVLEHEDWHNRGIPEHCLNKKCLMYGEYQTDLILGVRKKSLCNKCRKKVRPTTLDWLERMKR